MGEQLFLELPFPPRAPQLRDLGWDVAKGVYRHEGGATVERRCWHDAERGRLVFEARVNGGDWHETSERFWETLARAEAEHG